MNSAEERLVALLRQFGRDLLEAKAEANEDSRLDEILRAADAIESPQSRFEVLTAFAYELYANHALKDSLAMRVAAIAHVVVRILLHVDAALATQLALLLAGKLESLEDEEGALSLIDQEIDRATTGSIDAIVWRAATAMRLRILVALKKFDRGNQIVDAYELDERREADAFELDILVNGAKCAAMANRQDSAVHRALQAIERHQCGDAVRRGSKWLDVIVPPTPTLRLYLTAGAALRGAQRPLEAIRVFQQGRRQAVRESNAHAAAFLMSEVGITWELVGEFARGATFLERAATEAEKLGEMELATRWRKQLVVGENGLADLSGLNGLAIVGQALQVGAATEEHERIIKAVIKQGNTDGTELEPMARNLLAALYETRGDSVFALMAVRAAVESADRLQARWLALSLRSNEARILFKAGCGRFAQRLSERVLGDAQRVWDEASTSEERQLAVAAASRVAEIALLVGSVGGENHIGEPLPVDPGLVRRISDQTRARSFNRWIELIDWSRGLGILELEKAICSLISADLAVECAAQDGQAMNRVLEHRDKASDAVAAIVERTGTRPPDLVTCVDDGDLKLPADVAAIELSSIESGVVCLFAEHDKSLRVLHIPWERPRRKAWRARWSFAWNAEVQRLGLNRSDLRAPILPPDEELPVDAVVSDTLEALYEELDREFVRPLVDALGDGVERLIVSVHAELYFIPLWALTRRRPALSLSLVPSLRSIGLLSRRPQVNDGKSIAIGDATGSLAMVSRECELLTGFLPLPATIGALVEALPSARRVHFAGHGEFDAENPYLSGLVLRASHAPPHVVATGGFGCGRLTVCGIFERLDARNCDLVTISACSVGAPRDHASSEFTSVPTALLLAGARNVVAASWQVHDAATTIQMAHFHAELKSAKSIATALATSRQRLATTSRIEARRILGREDLLPDGELPFASPLFTDSMIHFGIG